MFGYEFWIGTLFGVVLSVIGERLLGYPLDTLLKGGQRRYNQYSGRRLAKNLNVHERLIPVGQDYIYVYSFSGSGYDIHTRVSTDKSNFTDKFANAPAHFHDFIPENPSGLQELANAKRLELERDEGK